MGSQDNGFEFVAALPPRPKIFRGQRYVAPLNPRTVAIIETATSGQKLVLRGEGDNKHRMRLWNSHRALTRRGLRLRTRIIDGDLYAWAEPKR